MDRLVILKRIAACRLIVIVRTTEANSILPIIEALLEGGVEIIEISLTTPGALVGLQQARQKFDERLLLGAGTVLSERGAQEAIESGAQFIISPHNDPVITRICQPDRLNIPVFPGALTPTEILTAWRSGADLVKVFPASLGGPQYIREVLAPLSHIQLLPTGGVNLENMLDYLDVGAVAVAVGSSLVNREIVQSKDWPALKKVAKSFVAQASAPIHNQFPGKTGNLHDE